MVSNPTRRAAVTDAALELLGREGARAVTHRAVDHEAGVPMGTCANYFARRADLLAGMAQRIFVHLEPEPARLAQLQEASDQDAGPEYVAYVVERLLARPALGRALVELRLEAARTPEVAGPLVAFLRQGFEADVAFQAARGLPGGRQRVLQLHHLVDGVLLDALTTPLDPNADPVAQARAAARALYA